MGQLTAGTSLRVQYHCLQSAWQLGRLRLVLLVCAGGLTVYRLRMQVQDSRNHGTSFKEYARCTYLMSC